MTGRQKRAQETKQKILESALSLFRERGFEAVTVDEITRKANVAKGSFYTYFATKSDIVVEEFWNIDAYYRSYAKNLSRCPTAKEKILAFTRAQTKYVRDTVGVGNLKILYANQILQEGNDKVILSTSRFWHTLIRDLIKEGQERGEFRVDAAAGRLATLLNRAMRSVFLDWCITGAAFDLVEEGRAVMEEWILRALQSGISP